MGNGPPNFRRNLLLKDFSAHAPVVDLGFGITLLVF
jgi:hypothetical protein